MILKKAEPNSFLISPSINGPDEEEVESKVPKLRNELRRLFVLTCATGLFLSLVSYHPQDPSWSSWSGNTEVANWMGRFGSVLADALFQCFGLGAFSLAVLVFLLTKKTSREADENPKRWTWLGPLFLVWASTTLSQIMLLGHWKPYGLSNPGGIVGNFSLRLLEPTLGKIGTPLIALVFFLASVIMVFHWLALTTFSQYLPTLLEPFKRIASYFKLLPKALGMALFRMVWPQKDEEVDANHLQEGLATGTLEPTTMEGAPQNGEEGCLKVSPLNFLRRSKTTEAPVPRIKGSQFTLPPLTLLADRPTNKVAKATEKEWFIEKGNILVEKLRDFGVEGEIVNICPGPVITVYEFKPASGVKIREIANLSDDLTLALSVLSVRIVAPIPGKPVVGIEIPTPQPALVLFKDLLKETSFFNGELKLPLLLGRLASGEPVASDLGAMPHLLVAGATGTGKSVFINTLILSLVYRFTPDELKLILVDPKMVELSHYDGIPHLLLPVVMESKKAAAALRWVVDEMERRYLLMHQSGVRHLDHYNKKIAKMPNTALSEEEPTLLEPLPYVVVIIDEYADLMATVPKDVELSISRLAQKARAAGIHLVLATQRPSTDVVTGTIKSNFPSRISFRVASAIDSRTILDRAGAERLLGKGDMLFYSAGFTSLKRMQAAYVSDDEIQRVVDHLKAQGAPNYDESILEPFENEEENAEGESNESSGELYDHAVRIVAERGEASISLVQRHLRIGYNRAANLIEEMEKRGVVGPAAGPSKRRQVLVDPL